MKTKFEKIDLNKLPKEVKKELEEIKTGTENFSDADLIEVYQDNFDELYKLIQKKYPEAIKGSSKKTVKKAAKTSAKKKSPAKKAAVKSDPEKEQALEDIKDYPDFPTETIKKLYDLEVSAEQEEEAPQYIIDIRKNALEKELKKRDPEWLKSRKGVYEIDKPKKKSTKTKSKLPAKTKSESKFDALYKKAIKLLYQHIGNNGKLDYSDKEYGYLTDELDMVEVGFLENTPDGTHQQELKNNDFTLTEEEAVEMLKHRIDSIEQEIGTDWDKDSAKPKPVKSKKYASDKKKSKTTKPPVEPPKPTKPEEDIAACKQVISEYNKARRSENPPVKHQDRTIIKNRVESVFKTVYKGYKSKGNKDYKNRLKIAQEAQELFSDLIINFDSALQSGSISDAEKIVKGIKSLV